MESRRTRNRGVLEVGNQAYALREILELMGRGGGAAEEDGGRLSLSALLGQLAENMMSDGVAEDSGEADFAALDIQHLLHSVEQVMMPMFEQYHRLAALRVRLRI